MASDETNAIAQKLNELSQEFSDRATVRHEMGSVEYGPLKFLEADTLEMAIEEVLDLANYARYTFIKLRLLQEHVSKEAAAATESDTTGGGFISTKDLLK